MADVQDEDQWLYGDEKEDGKDDEEETPEAEQNGVISQLQDSSATLDKETEEKDISAEPEGNQEENKPEEDGKDEDDDDGDDKDKDSSDDDDLTVTIGEVKKQSDIIADNIIQPTAHPNRFQPKAAPTSGLKDDDFNNAGKINGVAVGEIDMSDYEDKPWRKPGADLADYFNYGFVEDTWLKYCEKQKKMRVHESKTGLGGLGGTLIKATANVPIINDNSKYVGQRKIGLQMRPKGANESIKPEGNTIQVMTADRRVYSSKATNNYSNDNMDFGGDLYSNSNSNSSTPYFNPDAPPPNFYNPPPSYGGDSWGGRIVGTPPPSNWMNNNTVAMTGPPPDIVTSGPPPTTNYDDDSRGRRLSPDDDRHRSRRSHHIKRNRSPSRHHRRSRSYSRSRSRSRSPSHSRHKKKKSKRDRDD